MTVLFDTNVVLDVLLDRPPHAEPAVVLFTRVHEGELHGLLGATTLTTIHYLTQKARGAEVARQAVADLLALFDVAPVTRAVLEEALALAAPDFEDAVLAAAGRAAGAEAVVTRDPAGFRGSALRVYAPSELEAALQAR
ncbi:MAG TPA: PIN domain-containing protein [Rubricoccaceae bacterium]|jgi:predicted nucleic acid-binding protein|nr:PIN domain-containing protein [Rubricoccaceae bacterium]